MYNKNVEKMYFTAHQKHSLLLLQLSIWIYNKPRVTLLLFVALLNLKKDDIVYPKTNALKDLNINFS